MGGFGSGNTWRGGSKTTVEDCLTLAIWRMDIYRGADRQIFWKNAFGHTVATIGYFVEWDADPPAVVLTYRLRNAENVDLPIELQSTVPGFGGRRWWFTCPLIVGGVRCRRRVGKLYLPGGGRYFGCRTCYDLTYRSAQEAHSWERLMAHFRGETKFGKLLNRVAG